MQDNARDGHKKNLKCHFGFGPQAPVKRGRVKGQIETLALAGYAKMVKQPPAVPPPVDQVNPLHLIPPLAPAKSHRPDDPAGKSGQNSD